MEFDIFDELSKLEKKERKEPRFPDHSFRQEIEAGENWNEVLEALNIVEKAVESYQEE